MAHSDDFPDKLNYVRWLWYLANGEPPTNEAIAGAGGRTGQWLTGLIKQGRAPTKAADHKAMAAFFGVSREWLFDGEGDAPRPELWAVWQEARGGVKLSGHVNPETVRAAPRAPKKKPSRASR